MAKNDLKVGDIVELVDAQDMPWPEHVGKRGVVHQLPTSADDPNMIVSFDDPDFSGVSTRVSHFRKVE